MGIISFTRRDIVRREYRHESITPRVLLKFNND